MKVGFSNLWNRRFNHWEPRRAQPQEPGCRLRRLPVQQRRAQSAHAARDAVQRLVKQPWDLGIYAQDAWTHAAADGQRRSPVRSLRQLRAGDAPRSRRRSVPTRDITFPETQMLSFKDIVPRLGATIDLFGTQKTALKIGLNKYTQALGHAGRLHERRARSGVEPGAVRDAILERQLLPGRRSAARQLRARLRSRQRAGQRRMRDRLGHQLRPADAQHDLRPENDERLGPSAVSVGVLGGRRSRAGVASVSTSVGYFRRSFGNFTVVDNLALGGDRLRPVLGDGAARSAAARRRRLHDRAVLRSQSGHAVTRPADNRVRLASDYGDQAQVWSGVDLSVNARMAFGLTVSGGVSTGRTVTDNCEILAQVP